MKESLPLLKMFNLSHLRNCFFFMPFEDSVFLVFLKRAIFLLLVEGLVRCVYCTFEIVFSYVSLNCHLFVQYSYYYFNGHIAFKSIFKSSVLLLLSVCRHLPQSDDGPLFWGLKRSFASSI
ncbi:hypothetical protein ABFS83_03G025700 [Erythranthe nasuta]